MRPRTIVQTAVGLVSVVAALAATGSVAAAARPASASENAAIKRVALRLCRGPSGCTWHGALVSTRDPRYAWGRVIGEGVSGVLVRRSGARGGRFRVLHLQGGGIELCSVWRKQAPRRVLRDLRVKGLVASGAVVSCG